MTKKLIYNAAIAFAGAIILPLLLWEPLQGYCWQASIGLFIFFFCVAAFYGDDHFNITGNWGAIAIRVKNIIGYVMAFILFVAFILFMAGLVVIFHESNK